MLVMLPAAAPATVSRLTAPGRLSEHDLDQGLIPPATARRVYRFVRAS